MDNYQEKTKVKLNSKTKNGRKAAWEFKEVESDKATDDEMVLIAKKSRIKSEYDVGVDEMVDSFAKLKACCLC